MSAAAPSATTSGRSISSTGAHRLRQGRGGEVRRFRGHRTLDSTARLAPEIHRAEDAGDGDLTAAMREEIRKVILEELRDLFMGS